MPETGTVTKRIEDTAAIKPVKPENLAEKVNSIFESIARRAFEIFEGGNRGFGHDLENWFKAESELLHPVHVNVTETDETVGVIAEVPGFTEKNLEVGIEPRRLTITGKRETRKDEKKGKTVYTEACSDQILRIVELPSEVETEKATTTLKHGVLEITVPKVAKARNIAIQTRSTA